MALFVGRTVTSGVGSVSALVVLSEVERWSASSSAASIEVRIVQNVR